MHLREEVNSTSSYSTTRNLNVIRFHLFIYLFIYLFIIVISLIQFFFLLYSMVPQLHMHLFIYLFILPSETAQKQTNKQTFAVVLVKEYYVYVLF